MQQHIKQLMMTLALLVTAAAGAWADIDYLYLVVDGTGKTATMYWGDAGTKPKYSPYDGFADGHNINEAVLTIETLTIDASCQNHHLTTFSSLFKGWIALTTINNIENLKTEGVQNMGEMFRACSSLQTVDLSSFNTASVTDMGNMFAECTALENIYVGDGWSTDAVTNGLYMFDGCSKLPGYDANKIDHAMAKLVDDGGYLQKKAIELAWDPVTKTATLDEMPEGNVVVNVEYYTWAGVTLSVTGQTLGGSARLMKKLDDGSFADMTDQDQVKEDNKFILMVNKEDGYDFKIPGVTFEEFTENEYVEYYNWAKANDINVPLNSALLWVTMPHVESGNLNLEVNFQQMMTYTLLYQPATGSEPQVVACKMERTVKGTDEVSYMAMRRGASMGDGTAVWTTTMQAAYGPTKVAFVPVAAGTSEADLTTALNSAALGSATISQNANDWTSVGGAKYLIIGGNAKVVTAAFVADGNAVTTYKDFQVDEAIPSEGGVQYQLAVCLTDNDGNVTTAGTVKAPAAPAAAQGMKFDGWRGYAYDGNGRLVEKIFKKGDDVSLRGNMTLLAIWSPQQITTTFALNGGANFDGSKTVDYGQKLNVSGEPKRSGLVFAKWTVAKAVNESGILFGRGSQFDMNTPLTANLELTAQWKHVHEYTCYQISRFPSLEKYMKYNGVLHIAVCGCEDVEIVEHELNPAGKCACGYQKPGAQQVQLDIAYGKLEGTTYTNFANGFPEFPMKGDEVKVEAFHNWGNLEFKTWQYSTDGGQTWNDLAAFEIVGFLIPCNMKVRAIYVNPVTTPTIELASSEGTDQTVYQGQTYKMGNILYQMNYKLPDGYKLLDAGIRMGDNAGISYYFEQTAKYSYDAEAKGVAAGIGAGVVGLGIVTNVFLGGGFDVIGFTKDYSQAMFDKAEEVVYLEREENVMVQEKMSAATLAKKMYESTPINVDKYDPIYWEANTPTKGLFGSMATMPPLRFAQKNNQDHYIYGIAYMRYMTPGGEMKVLYTDAIAATVNNPNGSTKKEAQPSNAPALTLAPAASTAGSAALAAASTVGLDATATRRAPVNDPTSNPTDNTLDLSTITAPQTQLVVYVDGEYSGQLSNTYGYNETVSLTAPDEQNNKTFSYWTTDDGDIISTAKALTLTMKANTTLRAVYGAAASTASPAAITSVTRTNDGKSIVLNAIATGTLEGAGFIYSTTATGNDLTIGADGVTQIAAVKYSSLNNTIPASVIDKNNCWSAQITPGENNENTIYHVRAYTTNSGNTTYSEVKDVKLSTLKSGLMMVANINAFDKNAEPNANMNALLTQLKAAGQLPAGVALEIAAGKFATYYGDKVLTLSDESAAKATIYTITAVNNDKTKATAKSLTVAAANTPLLVKNTTADTQTIMLMPTDNAATSVNVYPGFKGTLDAKNANDDGYGPWNLAEGTSYFVFNSSDFITVKEAIDFPANRCWLEVAAASAPAISIVFDDNLTGIESINENDNENGNGNWYDLNGRKLSGKPAQKGVYVRNGKKVVVR